jgi:outer membrane protein OmpA-like peptidoglycan-associated protein
MSRYITCLQRAVLALVALATPQLASAQTFDVQHFKPAPNQQDNYFSLESVRQLAPGQWEAGLLVNYANDPLVLTNGSGDRVRSIVSDQLTGNVLAAIGILKPWELGVDVPIILMQKGEEGTQGGTADISNAGLGVGDVHLVSRFALFQADRPDSPGGAALGLAVAAFLPTGNKNDLQGEGFRLEPRLVLDYAFGKGTRLSASAGYMIRPQSKLLDTTIDDALTLGLGADVPLDSLHRFHAIGEVTGDVTVTAKHIGADEIPLEALLGGRYVHKSGFSAQAAFGFGMNVGFGTPDYRILAGVTYRRPHDPDPDGDGLTYDADRCPDVAEDFDHFEDEDGCPDPDNDGDGLPDTADRCPNDPEDRDSFEDNDGCADPDNDKDGVLDASDKCVNEPEDRDGFEDDDGCADPDNDKDGVPDVSDGCPDQPEDKDGFEDGDGCPDPDNDKDGVLDVNDKCPDAAEDLDGFEDSDGCAEPGSGLVKVTCDTLAIQDKVYFDTNSDRIQSRSFALLDQVAGVLQSATYIKRVRVEGHTDDRGDDKRNLDLSQRRADAVRRYLSGKGVAESRVEAQGFGETKPIASNKTNAGRGQNRRVDFTIVERDAACKK